MTKLRVFYSQTGEPPFTEGAVTTDEFRVIESRELSKMFIDDLAARNLLRLVGGDLGENSFEIVEGPTRFLGCVVVRYGHGGGAIDFMRTEPA